MSYIRQTISWIKVKSGHNPADITVHPKYGRGIKYVFTCGGTHYYELLNFDEIYEDRQPWAVQFGNECNMKITSDSIIEFMDAILAECSVGGKKETINIGRITELVNGVKYRAEWLFEPDSLYRMASVMFFDLKEDIRHYDLEYNKKKIEDFKKKGQDLLTFLLRRVLGDKHPFLNLSAQDSQLYLSQLQLVREGQQKLIRNEKDLKTKSENPK